MEAPKCKLCGQRHYGLCVKVDRTILNVEPQRIEMSRRQSDPTKFDRTAYQRDYMRKRRAKEKK